MTQTCLVSSIRPEPVVANLTSVVSLKAQNEKDPFKLRILVYVRGVFPDVCSVKISAELYIVYLKVYSIRYVRLFTRPRPDRILNFSRKSR